MTATLETLPLTPDELAAAKEAVRRMAYAKWLEAGSPEEDSVRFWCAAETEWIEYQYVPHRLPERIEERRDRTLVLNR